eukprot:2503601-Amphidinium_carterae.1
MHEMARLCANSLTPPFLIPPFACCRYYRQMFETVPSSKIVTEVLIHATAMCKDTVMVGVEVTGEDVSPSVVRWLLADLKRLADDHFVARAIVTSSEGIHSFWHATETRFTKHIVTEMRPDQAMSYLQHLGCDLKRRHLENLFASIPLTFQYLQNLNDAKNKDGYAQSVQRDLFDKIDSACKQMVQDPGDLGPMVKLLQRGLEASVSIMDLRQAGVEKDTFVELLVKPNIFLPTNQRPGGFAFQSQAARRAAQEVQEHYTAQPQ